jgi:purine-binding chemotaxis protein CheW
MSSNQFVVFKINNEEYGIDTLAVNGILRPQKFKIHRVPGVPDVIEGMIDLRGRVNYIFNLGKKLGLQGSVINEESRFIMLNINDVSAGCVVDEVTDIVTIADEDIQQQPAFANAISDNYIAGIAKIEERLIILLNQDNILSVEEFNSLK